MAWSQRSPNLSSVHDCLFQDFLHGRDRGNATPQAHLPSSTLACWLLLLPLNSTDGPSRHSPHRFQLSFYQGCFWRSSVGFATFFFLKTKIVVGDKMIYLISGKRQPLSQQTSTTSPFHVLPSPFFLFSLPFPPLTLVNPWLLICFTFFSKELFFLSFFYWYFLMPSLIFLESFVSKKEWKHGPSLSIMLLHLSLIQYPGFSSTTAKYEST